MSRSTTTISITTKISSLCILYVLLIRYIYNQWKYIVKNLNFWRLASDCSAIVAKYVSNNTISNQINESFIIIIFTFIIFEFEYNIYVQNVNNDYKVLIIIIIFA